MDTRPHSTDTRRHSTDTRRTLDGHSTLGTRWDWWCSGFMQLRGRGNSSSSTEIMYVSLSPDCFEVNEYMLSSNSMNRKSVFPQWILCWNFYWQPQPQGSFISPVPTKRFDIYMKVKNPFLRKGFFGILVKHMGQFLWSWQALTVNYAIGKIKPEIQCFVLSVFSEKPYNTRDWQWILDVTQF